MGNKLRGVCLSIAGATLTLLLMQPVQHAEPEIAVMRARVVPDDYFGMTLNRPLTTPWPPIPVGALRTWDMSVAWADINLSPGVNNWSKLDAIIALAQDRGVDLIYTFGRTPKWASLKPNAHSPYGPGQCAPPANMQVWDDFVRAVVTRAAGRIRYWEIWNEPQDPDFYCGDVPTMVVLAQRAYDIIKASDPSLSVLTPSPVGGLGPQWMSKFLKAGGGRYADIMAFHGYWDANAESVVSVVSNFRRVFAAHGQGAKPLWNTEGGWGQAPSMTADQQSAFIVKYYLLQWSMGVDRSYWYSYDSELGWGTLWTASNGLLKPGNSYGQVRTWMTGAMMKEPCARQARTKTVWTCYLERSNGYQAMAIWTAGSSGFTDTYKPPAPFTQYRDVHGNLHGIVDGIVRIGTMPILLESFSAF